MSLKAFGDYPVRQLARNCYLSVLVGASSALTYKQLKKNPANVTKILRNSTAAGGAGIILGLCYGYVRKAPSILTSGLMGGCKMFLISGCYMGTREALIIGEGIHLNSSNKRMFLYEQSAISGAITGFIVGSFWWTNLFPIITTSVGFCAFTATGHFVTEKFTNWKLKKGIARQFPELGELQWMLLEEDEQKQIRKQQQGWISWILELLQDRPYSAKIKLKLQDLSQELLLLEEEELRLNLKLGITDIVQDEEQTLPS